MEIILPSETWRGNIFPPNGAAYAVGLSVRLRIPEGPDHRAHPHPRATAPEHFYAPTRPLAAPLPHFYASTLLRGVSPQFPLPTGNGALEAANEPLRNSGDLLLFTPPN